MLYLGGKNRLGPEIAQLLNKFITKDTIYIEPFIGSGGVIPYINNPKKIILNDKHSYLIEMWRQLNKGWLPTDEVNSHYLTKEQLKILWLEAKHVKDFEDKGLSKYSPGLIAYLGFQCSFGGMWFQSFAQSNKSRDYFKMGIPGLINKQSKLLQNEVEIYNGDYWALFSKLRRTEGDIKNCVIYLDPPYMDTAEYSTGKISHEDFWKNVEELSKNNFVFISEEKAPKGFIDILDKRYVRGLGQKVIQEKLFIHEKHKEKILDQLNKQLELFK